MEVEDAAAIGSLKSMSRFGLIQRPNQNGGLSEGMGTVPRRLSERRPRRQTWRCRYPRDERIAPEGTD